jgi:hypothetical protein
MLKYLLALLLVVGGAYAFTINVVDANTGAYLNATVNITYNQYSTYQEFSNESSTSINNNSGSYILNFSDPYIYMTYAKTSRYNNATWQVKAGGISAPTFNLSLDQCYAASNNNISLRIYSMSNISGGANGSFNTQECYNGTAWVTLRNASGAWAGLPNSLATTWPPVDGSYSSGNTYTSTYSAWSIVTSSTPFGTIFEEGVWWNVSSDNTLEYAPTGALTPNGSVNYSTANITVSVPGYASASGNNIVLSNSLHTFNLTPVSNTTFYFYDEINNTLLTGLTISIEASSSGTGTNVTTTNGSATLANLSYGWYIITYGAPGYNQRQYTALLPSGSSSTIILYLRTTAYSTPVLLQVRDESLQKVVNATVYVNARNLSGTNDYLVEMCVTDINGQCVISADVTTTTTLSNTTYRFVVIYQGSTVGDSGYTTISSTANSACNSALPCVQLLVTLGNDPLQTFFAIPRIQYTLINYSSGNFSFSVVDTAGIVQQVCLYTTLRAGTTYAQTNGSCVSSASAAIIVFSNASLGDETIARGVVYVGGQQVLLDELSVPNNTTGGAGNALFFVFVGILVLGTVFLSYKANASLALLMTGGLVVILFYINAFPLITNIIIVSVAGLFLFVIARSKE